MNDVEPSKNFRLGNHGSIFIYEDGRAGETESGPACLVMGFLGSCASLSNRVLQAQSRGPAGGYLKQLLMAELGEAFRCACIDFCDWEQDSPASCSHDKAAWTSPWVSCPQDYLHLWPPGTSVRSENLPIWSVNEARSPGISFKRSLQRDGWHLVGSTP